MVLVIGAIIAAILISSRNLRQRHQRSYVWTTRAERRRRPVNSMQLRRQIHVHLHAYPRYIDGKTARHFTFALQPASTRYHAWP